MNQSEQIDKLVEALAKAQGAIKNPQKNKKVSVRTKSGSNYEFEYADLTAIIDSIKAPLSENGLAYTQILAGQDEQRRYRLTTRLMHNSGQWISSETPLFVEEAGSQSFGSALTFMKRYALAALLGVAADSDDDANAADGNQAQVQDKGPRKPKSPAANPMTEGAATVQAAKEPQALPVPQAEGKSVDWIAWGQNFIAHAQASADPIIADLWLEKNQNALQTIKAEAPKVYKRLTEALGGVYPEGLEFRPK